MATNALLGLSAKQLREAATLRQQIESLEARLAKIVGSDVAGAVARAPVAAAQRSGGNTRKFKRSPAYRAKLSKAMKARWAKAKASGKTAL